jgi:DNA polymerase-1
MCGSDLSGIELRCLAHYLFPYDNGDYAQQILEGDIHTFNAEAFGVDRQTSKVLIYSMMYGGGDRLIGSVVGGTAAKGKKLKADFDDGVPAFAILKKNLKKAYARGYIVACDGRRLKIRSEHRSLSQLLQSAGALIAKQWVLLCFNQIKQKHGADAYIMGWIHDEIQVACKTKEIAEDVGNITSRMAEEAGRTLGIKIPIASEYSVGRTWAETH